MQAFLDFLFPPQCVSCDVVGDGLCSRCFPARAEALPFRVAGLTGSALGEYDGALKRAVLALKRGRRDVARSLAERMRALVPPESCVVPVPTTNARRRERGFDGCSVIASLAARDRVLPGLVQQAGDAQRGRSRLERLAAAGRFAWRGEGLSGRSVVLLDDVVTTGATLLDCANVLRAAGAQVSHAIVVARAPDRRRE